jgi:hypothetical protein
MWDPGLFLDLISRPIHIHLPLFAGFTLASTGGPPCHRRIAHNFLHFSVNLTTTGSHQVKIKIILNVIRLACPSFPTVRLIPLLDQCKTTSNFYQKYIFVKCSRSITLPPLRRRHIGATSSLSLLVYETHSDKWHYHTMYLCLFAYLVSRIYLQKHIISHNISQFLSHSSAFCGN